MARMPNTASLVGVPFLTALRCLRRARTHKDDIVLVLGATGGVGSAAVQIAKAMGSKRVLGAARSAAPGDADRVVLSSSPADSLGDAIPQLTDNHGADVVIDTVGDLELMAAAYSQLADRDFTFDIFQAYRKEIELAGCNTTNATLTEVADELRQLRGWFESGAVKTRSEDTVELMGLEDAIEKGYNGTGKKQAVIKMT
ncbi:hypothetical protein DTO195F2_7114 [Paecilomyces variotii]|nr:hypothetical protein DTO195F2_7114 [Paecilomyces variotii]